MMIELPDEVIDWRKMFRHATRDRLAERDRAEALLRACRDVLEVVESRWGDQATMAALKRAIAGAEATKSKSDVSE